MAELKAHIAKKHKQSLANSCPHCNEDFKSKKSLNIHIDSAHYDWKSIVNKEQCDHCQQKFETSDELEAHMQKCNRKASVTNTSQVNGKPQDKAIDNTSINDQKSKDNKSKKHQCEVCHVVFPTKCLLIKHVTLVHPEAQIPDQSVVELPLPKQKATKREWYMKKEPRS